MPRAQEEQECPQITQITQIKSKNRTTLKGKGQSGEEEKICGFCTSPSVSPGVYVLNLCNLCNLWETRSLNLKFNNRGEAPLLQVEF